MLDVMRFRQRARGAYERGRLRVALRVGLLIGPVAVLCAWETGAVSRTFGIAAALWVVASLIRWRQVHGVEVVAAGLRSGAVPLIAALALCRFAPACPPHVALALCGVAGLVAGGALGRTVARFDGAPWRRWLAAAAVGGLLATLGCLALGIGSAVGAAAGLMVGAAAGALLPHRAVA